MIFIFHGFIYQNTFPSKCFQTKYSSSIKYTNCYFNGRFSLLHSSNMDIKKSCILRLSMVNILGNQIRKGNETNFSSPNRCNPNTILIVRSHWTPVMHRNTRKGGSDEAWAADRCVRDLRLHRSVVIGDVNNITGQWSLKVRPLLDDDAILFLFFCHSLLPLLFDFDRSTRIS